MTQFLRPDGTITSTRIDFGDHDSINETSSNNSPYIQTLSLSVALPARYECSLSNPTGTPNAGISTVRYRARETVDGSFIQARLVQGTTVLDTGPGEGLSSLGFTTFEWEPDTSGITDWTDIRLRFDFTVLSGSGPVGRLSWVEMEVPDSFQVFNETITETITASDSFAAAATINVAITETVGATDTMAGGLLISESISETITASDSFLGGKVLSETITENLTASDGFLASVHEPNGWTIPAPAANGWMEKGSGGGGWTEVAKPNTDWTER